MQAENIDGVEGTEGDASGPTARDVAEALASHVNPDGSVPAGVAFLLMEERGWRGRAMDVLAVLTRNTETMGYLAGGRRPEELATWLSVWVDSPLSLEQIELITASRGWDPDPFVTLARAGILERVLVAPDGTPRRIAGELAGGWVSDQLALAGEEEIIERVQAVLGPEAVRD